MKSWPEKPGSIMRMYELWKDDEHFFIIAEDVVDAIRLTGYRYSDFSNIEIIGYVNCRNKDPMIVSSNVT